MGKDSTTTTMPEIPENVMTFIDNALARYSGWANQGYGRMMGGDYATTGYLPEVGSEIAPGQFVENRLNPNFYDLTTGEWIGAEDPPSVRELMDQGHDQAEAQEIIAGWGQDANLEDFLVIVDADGNQIGDFRDMAESGELGDFWQDHIRPVVGPDELELLAGEQAQGLSELPDEYQQGLDMLQGLLGLDENELMARDILLQANNQAQDSELPEWARALREAGAEEISLPDIVNTPIYNELSSAFQESLAPMVDAGLAGAGLGLSAGRGAAHGAAFAPYIQDMIGKALATEESNRSAKMGGIQGGAGILADDLNRALEASGLASSGLMNLGAAAKGRIGEVASGYFGTGAAEQAARLNEITSLMNIGGTYRDVAQQQAQAPWEEWMRQAAAFESSIGGPMGMVPSAIGAESTSSKKD